MNVFELAAVLTLNKDSYDKGMKDAESSASGFGDKLSKAAKVGAAGVAAMGTAVAAAGAALVKGAGETAEYGDNIDKMSQKLGMTAEAYQKWDYVLAQSGADIDSMQTGMKTLTNQIDEAKNGSADAQARFEALGISMEDLATMSREDVFAATVAGFQGMADSTERAALANDLFGKSGQNLTPLFNESAEATENLKMKAEELGMVMSDEAVQASANYKDSLDTLQRTLGGLKNRLFGDFMPGITSVMDGLAQIIAGEDGLPKIAEGISSITDKITQALPRVLTVASNIVLDIAGAIIENLPQIMDAGIQVVMELSTGIVEMLPQLLTVGIEMITSLISGISDSLPELLDTIVNVVLEMVIMLTEPDTLNGLLEAGLELMLALINGLVKAIPQIIAALPKIIDNMINFFISAMPQIVDAGIQLFLALIDAMPEILDAIIKALPQIISSIVNGLMEYLPKLIEMGGKLLMGLIKGIIGAVSALGEAVTTVMKTLADKFKEKFKDALSWGKDLIDNFVQGIKDRMHKIVDIIKEIAQKIKNLLGFSEPKEGPLSNFHTYAPDMVDLFAKGVKENEGALKKQISTSFNFGEMVVSPSIKKGAHEQVTGITAIDEILNMLKDGSGKLTVKIENTRELVRAYG